MEEEAPISIEADDQSAGVRHCFFQLDEDPTDAHPFAFLG
jgi:hypothetical protein